MSIITISSLPYVITHPGAYQLDQDFIVTMAAGNAIEVRAENVTVDFMHHSIDNQKAGVGTTANGVYADGYKFCTVRNGRVSGFAAGISLRPGSLAASVEFCGYLIESMTASANVQEGIRVRGVGNVIRNNLVAGSQVGIKVGPKGASTVIGNGVFNNGTGIEVSLSNGSVVEHNRIGRSETRGGAGIVLIDSSNLILRNNSIYNVDKGIQFDPLSWGMYADNIVVHSGVPIVSAHAVAAGTTNFSMP